MHSNKLITCLRVRIS